MTLQAALRMRTALHELLIGIAARRGYVLSRKEAEVLYIKAVSLISFDCAAHSIIQVAIVLLRFKINVHLLGQAEFEDRIKRCTSAEQVEAIVSNGY